ncbi:Malolactic regulator [Lacticaseibacillus rhamnosus]|nr:Malolactic regulator [Lacticaseibacillus rhamnosus]AXI95889.1 Malolactic regulator [Lacticaseibacillus rhamnosus GG]ART97337.1 Malolactic regulator [Lacticaseibacillus rhamnosus]AZZ24560.1 Malolactic regulator [Lacticaseibacillus rhamnosus]PCL29205.1 Malolactic regulator [Lacticaseibacillus rhamnosus]
MTRSPAQESAYKDLRRNGQSQGHHVLGRTYIHLYAHNALTGPETCV